MLFLLIACAKPETDLWIGGDLFVGRNPPAELLSDIRPPGIGIVNLEGAVTRDPPESNLRLTHAPSVLPFLAASGIRMVSVANNHAKDGPMLDFQEFGGVIPASGPHAGHLSLPAFELVLSAWDLSEGLPEGLEPELQRARPPEGVLIASFHVTGPVSYLPRTELKEATEIALRAGASVVMAHGSHVLGPLQWRGEQLVAWGLGNIAFACDCTEETDAMLLGLHFVGRKLETVRVLPIRAGLRGEKPSFAKEPQGILDLLGAIGSGRLEGGMLGR